MGMNSSPTLLRRLRAKGDARRWAVLGGDRRGVDLAVIERACASAAARLGRDLDENEIDQHCTASVAAVLQLDAEDPREAERLAHLREQAAFYRLTADERVSFVSPEQPRRLRAARAAQQWVEMSNIADVDLASVEQACADAADFLGRDLDLREVDAVCRTSVALAVHDREQQEAAAASAEPNVA
jgi:hypothetical protein